MQVRIISDLHIDINNKYPIEYNDDVFTIIAGDVCGYPKDKIKWIRKNIKNGIFIAGNHICYNKQRIGIQTIKKDLEKEFPIDSNVSFLENNYKIIDDKVFIGCTLYTDYKYPCPPYHFNQRDNMYESLRGLNDFRWGWYNENEKLVKLQPEHYLNEFKKSYKFLTEAINKFKDKECIVITHYAPSSKSIQEEFMGDKCNGSYISELEEFILDNPNIKYWIHGHTHGCLDYRIGETRVICNARGYIDYGDNDKFDKDLRIEI